MRLRTKLVLAFLLLAVVPLAGVTLFSYRSSIRAFREAVEAEADSMTGEMEQRMERVTADLGHRIDRLDSLPYDTLLAAEAPDDEDVRIEDAPTRFLALIRNEMGDAAPLLSALEYVPFVEVSDGAEPREESEPLVIHFNRVLGSESDALFDLETSRVIRTGRDLVFLPSRVEAAGDDPEVFVQVMSDALESLKMIGDGEFGTVINEIAEMALEQAIEVESSRVLDESTPPDDARRATIERRARDVERKQRKAAERMAVVYEETAQAVARAYRDRQEHSLPAPPHPAPRAEPQPGRGPGRTAPPHPPRPRWELGREFTTRVHRDGETIGRLNAQIDGQEVLRTVLTNTRREQGEVPFAVTSDGTVLASSPADRATLGPLEQAGLLGRAGPSDVSSNGNWVIVKHQVPGTETTFGIARPVGERMDSIRRTAGRNMIWGLALVGLAMLGIVPLSGRMTRNLSALSDGAAEMSRGNLDVRVPVRSGDEIGELARVFNTMGASLRQQQQARVEQERLRKELEMCRQLQDEMLPAGRSSLALAELRAVSIPAREVGGDFFNYFELDDGGVALVMGDVSGKGVAAALLMANLQATLRARLPLAGDLAHLARALDAELEARTPAHTYVTLFMGVLDPGGRVLRYINAGHNPQYVVYANGKLGSLASSGRPLGLLAGGNYVEHEVPVEAGDSLFLFTDGLVESEDAGGDPFGESRLENLLVDSRDRDPDGILRRVESSVQGHRGRMEAADDATIMVLRVRNGLEKTRDRHDREEEEHQPPERPVVDAAE